MPNELIDHDPTITPTDKDQPVNALYPWIRHQAKVTLYLSTHWSKPRQGFLETKDNE